ncbi:hypothetical protein [Chitinimonas sp.]|uniref:hypothetical protein n=1 Tax=Chitinimonas sp. TaxID=1934313 RepID=UPI0035B2684F
MVIDNMAIMPESAYIVFVAQAGRQVSSRPAAGHTLGVCVVMRNDLHDLESTDLGKIFPSGLIDVRSDVLAYFEKFKGMDVGQWHGSMGPIDKVTQKVIKEPDHGRLVPSTEPLGGFAYIPNSDYVGGDHLIVQASVNGYTVQLRYYIHVSEPESYPSYKDCSKFHPTKGIIWKLSQFFDPTDDSQEGRVPRGNSHESL